MVDRTVKVLCVVMVTLLLAACPKGTLEYKAGRKAELEKDYDSALIHYERALKEDPRNVEYQFRVRRARFDAGTYHLTQGRKMREAGQLEPAAAEFEKAFAIDPSSFVAEQELRRTLELLAERRRQQEAPAKPPEAPKALEGALEAPPELAPISRAPINYKATADSKQIYETIGKLAGITVIFDPDYQPRRIPVELVSVTLEQALDMVALQTKTFWKPVTSNTIMVIPDTAAKRKDYEEQVIRTFYLSNMTTAQELTEIVTALRNLLDMRRIQPSTSQNAIIVRDTPDKVAVAEKIIRDIDRAKPEVLIQVAVLQARRDRARELGIVPGSSAQLIFSPRNPVTQTTTGSTTTGTTTGTTTTGAIRLSGLGHLASADYSVVLPGAQAMALLTDATTKIIQNPEVRATDGQTAKLRIGDRVPIATGSFQPGIGGVGINPLVNTQFQFTDVGVNLDITPRVNTSREISMKLMIEVSSVTQRVNIGGIEQPVIGQRRIEHDIRLREGEVSILGGIIEQTETRSMQGWPGLGQIPFLRHFFSSNKKEIQENEILIVLTPRIIRLPEITAANLRGLSVGSDQNVQIRSAPTSLAPAAPMAVPGPTPTQPSPGIEAKKPEALKAPEKEAETQPSARARMSLKPAQVNLTPGSTAILNVLADDVRDVFSVTFLLQFDPNVVEIQEVQHGGFLSSDGQAVAIVHRVDAQAGTVIISLTRPPETQGMSGSGTLVGVVLRGKAKGRTVLHIGQATARDSKQEPLPMTLNADAEVTVD